MVAGRRNVGAFNNISSHLEDWHWPDIQDPFVDFAAVKAQSYFLRVIVA
jgi:hypothetical protein